MRRSQVSRFRGLAGDTIFVQVRGSIGQLLITQGVIDAERSVRRARSAERTPPRRLGALRARLRVRAPALRRAVGADRMAGDHPRRIDDPARGARARLDRVGADLQRARRVRGRSHARRRGGAARRCDRARRASSARRAARTSSCGSRSTSRSRARSARRSGVARRRGVSRRTPRPIARVRTSRSSTPTASVNDEHRLAQRALAEDAARSIERRRRAAVRGWHRRARR